MDRPDTDRANVDQPDADPADVDRPDADPADVDADDLLKVILVLAIAWLLLEIVDTVLDLTVALVDAVPTLLAVAIVVLIALRLTDRL